MPVVTTESNTYSAHCASTGDSTAQFLVWLFTHPLLCCDSCLGLESAENCGGSAVAVGAVLGVTDTPVVFGDHRCLCWSRQCRKSCVSVRVLGLGSLPVVVQRQVPDGRDSADNCGAPQLVLLLDKVVDVPLLVTSWGSRGSAAAVPRLVCQLIIGMNELMRRLCSDVYTGARPG